MTGQSGLTYASADALTNIEGLASYVNFVEETLVNSSEKATGDWVVGFHNTKGKALRDAGFTDFKKVATFNEQSGDVIRVFDVSHSPKDSAFISDILDSMGDSLAYAYPELLHDTTSRGAIPNMMIC